jgi:hypothetical protein
MSKAYYKTSAPEVLSVLSERNEKLAALRKRGEAFQAHFGAKHLVVSNNTQGYRICGLVFEPPKPTRLWTCPDKQSLGQQRPRNSIVKATAEEKAELADLKARWKDWCPTDDVPFDPVLQAMGTTWGALIFGGSFALLDRGDTVYVATTAKLNEHMIEILASEYAAAEAQKDGVAA